MLDIIFCGRCRSPDGRLLSIFMTGNHSRIVIVESGEVALHVKAMSRGGMFSPDSRRSAEMQMDYYCHGHGYATTIECECSASPDWCLRICMQDFVLLLVSETGTCLPGHQRCSGTKADCCKLESMCTHVPAYASTMCTPVLTWAFKVIENWHQAGTDRRLVKG